MTGGGDRLGPAGQSARPERLDLPRPAQADSTWGVPVDEVARQLADVLERPVQEMLDALRDPGRYVRLEKGVHPAVADRLRDVGLSRRGVIIEENYRRYYPQGRMAAQLVGFVDEAGIGRQGLERYFHAELAGSELKSQRRIDRWGTPLELWNRDEEAASGRTVHTTLDFDIQRATERALDRILEAHKPLSATAVIIEVATGRVLAMATAPSFNPNQLQELSEDADYARTVNLAVAAAVEPGSVFKPFTMAAALESGLVRPETVIESSSPYLLHRVRIHDDHPHDSVTVSEMVKFSSNIAAAKLAQRIGPDALLRTFERFGFGESTGILTQGEAAGSRRPAHHFGPVELATISFGQGLTATALQLAMATAAIGNDGVLRRPLLVERVTEADGTVVREEQPSVVGRAMSSETAKAVTRAMEMVLEDGGTGTKARVSGYRVAGKTGTAEKVKGGTYSAARIATFVGFAPSDAPDLAMAILVDEPSVGSRYGGIVAGPMFSAVMEMALRHRGVRPDPALVEAEALASAVEPIEALPDLGPVTMRWHGGAWEMPDLAGRSMRDALAGLRGAGIALHVSGSGVLAEQTPPPGRPVRPGDVIQLRFQ